MNSTYDNRDRGNDRGMSSMGGRSNNDRGQPMHQGRNQQQPRMMMGSTSTSSYLSSSSNRYDDENNKGSRGSGNRGSNMDRKDDRGMMSRNSNSSQKGMQSSRSFGDSNRGMAMFDKPMTGGGGSMASSSSTSAGNMKPKEQHSAMATGPIMSGGEDSSVPVEDNNPKEEAFLDLTLKKNILISVLKQVADGDELLCTFDSDLAPQKLSSLSLVTEDEFSKTATPVTVIKKQVYDLLYFAFEKKEKHRNKCGELLAFCIKNRYISKSVVQAVFVQIFEQIEDVLIDVPMIFEYLAELLGK